MAFFYRHNPKKFNYIPRYYDPEKEALERKKAEMGLDSNLSHEEKFRLQMRKSWNAAKEMESKEEQRVRLIRRIVLGVFVVLVFYLVFGTSLMTNIVRGLMGN